MRTFLTMLFAAAIGCAAFGQGTTNRIRISELPTTNSVYATNIIPIVMNPRATNGTMAITLSNLLQSLVGFANWPANSSGPTNGILVQSGAGNNTTLTNPNVRTAITLFQATASRAAKINSSQQLTNAVTTEVELDYLSGVTSAIQAQLDGKQPGSTTLTNMAGTGSVTNANANQFVILNGVLTTKSNYYTTNGVFYGTTTNKANLIVDGILTNGGGIMSYGSIGTDDGSGNFSIYLDNSIPPNPKLTSAYGNFEIAITGSKGLKLYGTDLSPNAGGYGETLGKTIHYYQGYFDNLFVQTNAGINILTVTNAASGSLSNWTVTGTNIVSQLTFKGGMPASSILRTDGNTNASTVVIGANLTWDGNTLAATTGGGTLSVQTNSTAVGAQSTLNLIAGANVSFQATNNGAASKVDVQIIATGGGGGSFSGYATNLHMQDFSTNNGTIQSRVMTLPATAHLNGTNQFYTTNLVANLSVTLTNLVEGAPYWLIASNPAAFTIAFNLPTTSWVTHPDATPILSTNAWSAFLFLRTGTQTNAWDWGRDLVFTNGNGVTLSTNINQLVVSANLAGAAGISLVTNAGQIVISNSWPGTTNFNGEVAVTNATRMGLVYTNGAGGVSNLLRSVMGGYGLTLTNEATNIMFAVQQIFQLGNTLLTNLTGTGAITNLNSGQFTGPNIWSINSGVPLTNVQTFGTNFQESEITTNFNVTIPKGLQSGQGPGATNLLADGAIGNLYTNIVGINAFTGLTNIYVQNLQHGQTMTLSVFVSNGCSVAFPQFPASMWNGTIIRNPPSNSWSAVYITRFNSTTNVSVDVGVQPLIAGTGLILTTNFTSVPQTVTIAASGNLANWSGVATNIYTTTNDAWLIRWASNGVTVAPGSNITITTNNVGNQMVYTVNGTAGGGGGFANLDFQTNNVRAGLQTNISLFAYNGISLFATNNATSNKLDIALYGLGSNFDGLIVTNQITYQRQDFNGSNGTSGLALTNQIDFALQTHKSLTNVIGTNLVMMLTNLVQGRSFIQALYGNGGTTQSVSYIIPSGGTNITWGGWQTNGTDDIKVAPNQIYVVNGFVDRQSNVLVTCWSTENVPIRALFTINAWMSNVIFTNIQGQFITASNGVYTNFWTSNFTALATVSGSNFIGTNALITRTLTFSNGIGSNVQVGSQINWSNAIGSNALLTSKLVFSNGIGSNVQVGAQLNFSNAIGSNALITQTFIFSNGIGSNVQVGSQINWSNAIGSNALITQTFVFSNGIGSNVQIGAQLNFSNAIGSNVVVNAQLTASNINVSFGIGTSNLVSSNIVVQAGRSGSNAFVGGIIYVTSAPVTNGSAGALVNGMAPSIGGNTLTNLNDYLDIWSSGNTTNSTPTTNQIQITYGGTVFGDSGLQTISNMTWELHARIVRTGLSAQLMNGTLWWSGQNAPFALTNFGTTVGALVNGAANTLAVKFSSTVIGGISNTLTTIEYMPGLH